jgi:hypothetical protein
VKTLASLGVAALLAGLLTPACSTDTNRDAPVTEASGGCLVNSDCASPLVCAFQRCHVECVTTRDCDGTLRCVGAHEPARVCQLEVEAKCQSSADCPANFVCGSDGGCRDFCQSDQECVGSQVCTKGVCAEPAELDASGSLPQVLPFTNCRLNSDCAEGLRCAAGSCISECLSERDCLPGEACDAGVCREIVEADCQNDDECQPTGASCVEGQCRCDCHADVDCAAGESCAGCVCHAPPPPECSGPSDCAVGEQCVDGSCACACVEDRDCPRGQTCDGCACASPPAPTKVHDATVKDAADIALLKGIVEVETNLQLYGSNLISTVGLEALQSVGSLDLDALSSLTTEPNAPNPFGGLSGLTLIRGDLLIANLQAITDLELNPALEVQGNVTVNYTSMSCATLQTLEQTLAAHGFVGSFQAMFNGNCMGACSQGECFPVP